MRWIGMVGVAILILAFLMPAAFKFGRKASKEGDAALEKLDEELEGSPPEVESEVEELPRE